MKKPAPKVPTIVIDPGALSLRKIRPNPHQCDSSGRTELAHRRAFRPHNERIEALERKAGLF